MNLRPMSAERPAAYNRTVTQGKTTEREIRDTRWAPATKPGLPDLGAAATRVAAMAAALCELCGTPECENVPAMADIADECRDVAARLRPEEGAEGWYRAWSASADRARRDGAAVLLATGEGGDRMEAAAHYLKASLRYAAAGWFLDAPERDPRRAMMDASSAACLRLAAKTAGALLPDGEHARMNEVEGGANGTPLIAAGDGPAVERLALFAALLPLARAAGRECRVALLPAGVGACFCGADGGRVVFVRRGEDPAVSRERLRHAIRNEGWTGRTDETDREEYGKE